MPGSGIGYFNPIERTHEAIERFAGSLTTLTDAITTLGFLNEAIFFKLEGSCSDKMAKSS